MTASALFSVASASSPVPSTAVQPYAVNYGDEVTLQIVNMAGLEPIAAVVGISYAGQPLPAITYRGRGKFTFSMPANPGDTFGRSFLVEIVGNAGLDEFGKPNSKLVCRRVIGAPDGNGIVPICGNETGGDTDPTGLIGWIARLSTGGGGGSGNFLPLNGAIPMRAPLPFGGYRGIHLADPVSNDDADTKGARDAAIATAIAGSSGGVANYIGFANVTLVNGAGRVDNLPADFVYFPTLVTPGFGGRVTWTKSGTSLLASSTEPADNSGWSVLWYSPSGGHNTDLSIFALSPDGSNMVAADGSFAISG